jgi:D-alanyl-D-alanine carboxypeptidase
MRLPNRTISKFLPLALILLYAYSAVAQTQPSLSPELRSSIDELAKQTLAKSGTPSASVAVVQGGKIVYVQAYGDARLDPRTPARPEMRYSIGSISKQFTATAVLFLAEEGRLSLDDKVSKFVPGLTRGNEVTIRQLLSHTSGYQDFWPQDYVPPLMLKSISAAAILDMWAKKPLDFDPGTKWQYSNTNYVIAGLIVEKATGKSLLQFLRERVFKPLGMESVTDTDQAKLPAGDPEGYFRFALGPLRPAPKEGKGWMFAAGELAMTAEDLQKWNISVINRTLLKPASYKVLETEVLLNNGVGTNYALGLSVRNPGGHRELSHGGEVSGYTASSVILPDNGIAVVVLTNQDAVGTGSQISQGVVAQLLKAEQTVDQKADAVVKKILVDLSTGKVDRSLFTDNANFYFTDQAIKDFQATIAPLGDLQDVRPLAASGRGGMMFRGYSARFAKKGLRISVFEMPDGKIEQYLITGSE